MKKKIQHWTGSIRPDLDVRFVAKTPRTVQTFFPTKEPVSKHRQSNTVYAATCKECEDTYVGMTKRQTVTRLCEHGAPKDTFDRKTNNNVDGVQPITVKQQTRSSRNTTAKAKVKQQEPPLRRSPRIRKNERRTSITPRRSQNTKKVPVTRWTGRISVSYGVTATSIAF